MDEAGLAEWDQRTQAYTDDLKNMLCPVIEKHQKTMLGILEKIQAIESVDTKDSFSVIRETLKTENFKEVDIFNLGTGIFEVYPYLKKTINPTLMSLANTWLAIVEEVREQMAHYQEKHHISLDFSQGDLKREQVAANAKYGIGSDRTMLGVEHHFCKNLILRYNSTVMENTVLR